MQKIFGIGSDYFPESAWKIYVVNAPFALRMGCGNFNFFSSFFGII